ncbi:MAG: PaaI family thioesterase [Candidatus Dormibacteraeota bacterium]|nr:PaaI family thioesterase [Candidatus Dormibacteraeota bacterium]
MSEAAPGTVQLQEMLDGHEFTAAYGFQVVSVGGGEATIRAPFMKRWERPGGIVSGQVYMNAADCAMWVAILGNQGTGPITVTTELNTSFIAPAREEDITCTARILRNGRRLIYGLADCHGADGRLLSHHMLTYARADG